MAKSPAFVLTPNIDFSISRNPCNNQIMQFATGCATTLMPSNMCTCHLLSGYPRNKFAQFPFSTHRQQGVASPQNEHTYPVTQSQFCFCLHTPPDLPDSVQVRVCFDLSESIWQGCRTGSCVAGVGNPISPYTLDPQA